MTYEIVLEEQDYLTYQLYNASKNRKLRIRRNRSWLLLVIAFLAWGFVFLNNENSFTSYYFFTIAAITLFLYPKYSSWRYMRHYRNHIKDNYQDKFGEKAWLEFDQNHLISRNEKSEVKISYDELVTLNETKEYYFIKMSSAMSLIIPKRLLKDKPTFQTDLETLISKTNISHHTELDWKWK